MRSRLNDILSLKYVIIERPITWFPRHPEHMKRSGGALVMVDATRESILGLSWVVRVV